MVFGLVSMATLVGCAGPSSPPTSNSRLGHFTAPMVISSQPQHDTKAYLQASDQLSEADWRTLEQLGPRAIWKQLLNRDRRNGATPMAQNNAQAPTIAVKPHRHQSIAKDPHIVDLPDDRVRIIWELGNYGGAQVSSTRDKSTARRNVSIKKADLAPMLKVLEQHLGDAGDVLPMPEKNTLVITCSKSAQRSVLELLSQLDIAATQVEITVKIFEVNQDFDFQQGTKLILNHLASDNTQALMSTFSAKRFLDAMTKGTTPQGSVLQLMNTFQQAGVSVDMSFQLLADSGLIQVVSSPRMTVTTGQTGYLLAGQELPITSAHLANGHVQTATQYKPVGVQLYITPQSVGRDHVRLHTVSIVSAVSGFADLPDIDDNDAVLNVINPIIDSREAETVVTVPDGDTMVISGLRMTRTTIRENKIPGLGDIPVIEWLFKNHRTQQQAVDLYFFLTPRILP